MPLKGWPETPCMSPKWGPLSPKCSPANCWSPRDNRQPAPPPLHISHTASSPALWAFIPHRVAAGKGCTAGKKQAESKLFQPQRHSRPQRSSLAVSRASAFTVNMGGSIHHRASSQPHSFREHKLRLEPLLPWSVQAGAELEEGPLPCKREEVVGSLRSRACLRCHDGMKVSSRSPSSAYNPSVTSGYAPAKTRIPATTHQLSQGCSPRLPQPCLYTLPLPPGPTPRRPLLPQDLCTRQAPFLEYSLLPTPHPCTPCLSFRCHFFRGNAPLAPIQTRPDLVRLPSSPGTLPSTAHTQDLAT